MNHENRGPWYLLTGVVLGVIFGLVYAWAISPVRYVDTAPVSLRSEFKDQYRTLIAIAYTANGDLPRAEARLKLLGDPDPARMLTIQAQRALVEKRPDTEINALGALALALTQGGTPVFTPVPLIEATTATPTITLSPTPVVVATTSALSTSQTSTITSQTAKSTGSTTPHTPQPTNTPLPTRTPTPTPGAPFVLQDISLVCDQNPGAAMIQVQTRDAAGKPVPGVEVIVSWESGEDHFFTGLKPEIGLGYADYTMTPGVKYTLRLAEGGQPVPDLNASECEGNGGSRYWGAWMLVFAQP
jgi:hypothetical protein